MGIIRMLVVEISAAAVFLLPIYVLLNRLIFRDKKKSVLYCIFSLYLVAIYALVGMPNVTYVRFELRGNLIPFAGILQDLKNSILNVALFFPLGLSLPILWDKYRTARNTLLFGFGLSAMIEILQIFTLRATDVNDLITNVLGNFLGFLSFRFLAANYPEVRSIHQGKKPAELYMICMAVFFVMFFLQPFLSSVLWHVLLN